ncbi:MAG: hypothetical protein L0K86_24890, partial [Actinomycetia bacterium]|nr:hypothetical protein [Actinomycetes bacterium]
VVVAVSATAPAVLGAVVHLAVLVGRPEPAVVDPDAAPDAGDEPIGYELTAEAYAAGSLDEHGLSRRWETAPPTRDRATELIAGGAGRRRLSRELGVTEYEARRLLDRHRTTSNHVNGFGGASWTSRS